MNLFSDVSGDVSSTRVFEACIILTVIIVTFISVLTGKDLGNNVAEMLKFITSFVIGGCEAKKAIEYYSNKKDN